MTDKPLVFISCGQYTKDEIELGETVTQIIKKTTPFEPFFAEQENTLEGLVSHILSNLHRSAAFIGIMHHRGEIETPTDEIIIRGSVWIEQELAIAAYMQHMLNRKIEIALYLQNGIVCEGIRDPLSIKPVFFDTSDEVIEDLINRIQGWNLQPVPITNVTM